MNDKHMNIIFTTDIHQNYEAIKMINFSGYDLILCGGDFLNPSKPDLNLVRKIIDYLPENTFVVPGNCDKDPKVIEYMQKKLKFIHLKNTTVNGLPLAGIGYCRDLWADLQLYRNYFMNNREIILDFFRFSNLNFLLKFSGINVGNDNSIDILDEEETYNASKDYIDKFDYFKEEEVEILFKSVESLKGGIILTHSPPFNALDKLNGLPNVGSNIITEGIKKTKPRLVLCGHFHELYNTAKIDDTIIFNPGAVKDNRYGIIKFKSNNEIETIFKSI